MDTAEGVQFGDDVGCDVAFIVGVATAVGDLRQCLGEGGKADDIANARGLAVEKEVAGGGLVPGQLVDRALPVESDARGNGKAVAGIVDGRAEQFLQRPRAVVGQQRCPAIDGARNGDCVG